MHCLCIWGNLVVCLISIIASCTNNIQRWKSVTLFWRRRKVEVALRHSFINSTDDWFNKMVVFRAGYDFLIRSHNASIYTNRGFLHQSSRGIHFSLHLYFDASHPFTVSPLQKGLTNLIVAFLLHIMISFRANILLKDGRISQI
eukprot:Gb_16054 [translate_table: standard]